LPGRRKKWRIQNCRCDIVGRQKNDRTAKRFASPPAARKLERGRVP
jgi:hypothetical protein